MTTKLKLPLPLREENPRVVQRAWAEIRAERERASSPVARRFALPSLAFAAAVAVVLFFVLRPAAPPDRTATFETGSPAVVADEAAVKRALGDGSWFELARGGKGTIAMDDAVSVRFLLERGRLVLHVEPGGPRTWSVLAGPTTVTVVGTDLIVDRAPTATDVSVQHGVVSVRGPGIANEKRVAAGESLHVEDAPVSARPATPVAPEVPSIGVDSLPNAPSHAGSAPAPIASHAEAREKSLLEQADEARASGHPDLAVAPLQKLMKQSPPSPDAAVAAFMLGKVELDDLGHPDRAEQAFAECIRLGAPAAIAEDAHARLVDARAKSGNTESARAAAQEYRRLYPTGKHLARLQPWLGN